MNDSAAEVRSAPATLKAGSLHWLQVAALGIAIAISGNVSGWNYGLGVGGWGGMLLAALAMAILFLCLTQSLAELAAALPEAGGFDGYVRRALGPAAAYLAGMSVAIALAVGAALVILVAFCLFMAPEFQSARLFSAAPDGARSLLPHGFAGAARCMPFALF